jgi:hypothetical protein
MTTRLTEDGRSPATLTRWSPVEIGGRVHLVGVLVGGHDRLPAGAWVVTSPVRSLDRATRTAITASTGRRYLLLATQLEDPFPGGAQDVIARAMAAWRIAGPPPGTALTDAETLQKLGRSHLPAGATDPIEPDDDSPDGKPRR